MLYFFGGRLKRKHGQTHFVGYGVFGVGLFYAALAGVGFSRVETRPRSPSVENRQIQIEKHCPVFPGIRPVDIDKFVRSAQCDRRKFFGLQQRNRQRIYSFLNGHSAEFPAVLIRLRHKFIGFKRGRQINFQRA